MTMNLTSNKSRILAITCLLLACVGLLHIVTGVFDYVPRLRASAKSPDGSLTVKVYQKRIMPRPLFPRMGAVAKVYDSGGAVVYERTIFRDSDYDDTLGSAFTRITFEGEEIRIGPGFYEPGQVYVIRKADLGTR